MLSTKKIENDFNRMLHPDLLTRVYFSIENFDKTSETGIVVLLDEDFNELFRFDDSKGLDYFIWYLKDPQKNYNKALNSNNPYDNIFAILDKQTGKRTLDDWKDSKDILIDFFYNLRKKFQ